MLVHLDSFWGAVSQSRVGIALQYFRSMYLSYRRGRVQNISKIGGAGLELQP